MVVAIIPAAALAAGSDGTFTDDNGSVHEVNIETIFVPGITLGCSPTAPLYCPSAPVTRQQMASFLARMLHLPASATDYFDDDSGSVHQAAINSIAAAGITLGCDATGQHYCPTAQVTRAQMASFLARALDLNPAVINYFTDDEGNTHEANINRVALAGITLGCDLTGKLYCPNASVTRGQMASFLARSLKTGVNGIITVSIISPPDLITIPAVWNGSGYSALVPLRASAVSPTGKTVTVIWSSSVEGLLGTGSSTNAILNIPAGADSSQPIITATAVDTFGAIGTATVQIKLYVPSPGA
jgi:hypothetical protein